MTKIKILATADVHFERLDKTKLDKYKLYFVTALRTYKPDMFVIAGDTSDSRNLKAESEDFRNLSDFIIFLSKECDDLGIRFSSVRGTPSHEGAVLKNIIEINGLNIFYYEDIAMEYFKGYSVLYMPEMYCTDLKQFNNMVTSKTGKNKVDVCIFHGMMDFAIPALKQIDSSFNQSRSIVINSVDFQNRYIKNICFGGHIHRAINSDKIYYTSRFVNEVTQPKDSDMFGLKYIEVFEDDTHTIQNVKNPYLNDYKFLTIEITEDTDIEDINSFVHRSNVKNSSTVFTVIVDNTTGAKHTFGLWKRVYRPLYMKRKIVSSRISGVLPENLSKVSSTKLEQKDIDIMVKKIYEEFTNNKLDSKTLDLIKKGEE